MRWLFALVVLAAGCGTVLTPVVIREPRPEPLPLTIGVHYPDEVRSFRKVPVTDARGDSANAKILVGEASVKLIDDALGLLFARVVSVTTVTPVGSAGDGLSAVIEPRILAAALEVGRQGVDDTFARGSITYGFTLYSKTGERLASWTVSGAGLASSSTSLRDAADWNTVRRSLELALRDAAWNFTSGFRDVAEVRRWLDERGVK